MDAEKLALIRQRDARWRSRGIRTDAAGQDRRDLLQFVDELEQLAEQVQIELSVLRGAVRTILASKGEHDAEERVASVGTSVVRGPDGS